MRWNGLLAVCDGAIVPADVVLFAVLWPSLSTCVVMVVVPLAVADRLGQIGEDALQVVGHRRSVAAGCVEPLQRAGGLLA